MTDTAGGTLRVALLDNASGEAAALARALEKEGHDARILSARASGPLEAALRQRGFTARLTPVPASVATLLRGGFDVAHAFAAPDALAALTWRRLTGRPVVFTCAETLARAAVADARLRATTLQQAIERADALTVPSEAARAALRRWFALEARMIDPGDAPAHEALYRDLLAGAG